MCNRRMWSVPLQTVRNIVKIKRAEPIYMKQDQSINQLISRRPLNVNSQMLIVCQRSRMVKVIA